MHTFFKFARRKSWVRITKLITKKSTDKEVLLSQNQREIYWTWLGSQLSVNNHISENVYRIMSCVIYFNEEHLYQSQCVPLPKNTSLESHARGRTWLSAIGRSSEVSFVCFFPRCILPSAQWDVQWHRKISFYVLWATKNICVVKVGKKFCLKCFIFHLFCSSVDMKGSENLFFF